MRTFLTGLIPALYRAVEQWEIDHPDDSADDKVTIIHPISGNRYHLHIEFEKPNWQTVIDEEIYDSRTKHRTNNKGNYILDSLT